MQFYADDRVRVVKWVSGGTPKKASLVVIQTNLPDLNIQFQENTGTITLASAKIMLRLSESDGAIQYLTADNQILLKEQWAPGGTPQKASLVVIQTNLPDLNIQFQENAGTVTLASAKITLQLSESDGAIQYLTADNQTILKEQGAATIDAGQDQERKEGVQCSAEFQADAG